MSGDLGLNSSFLVLAFLLCNIFASFTLCSKRGGLLLARRPFLCRAVAMRSGQTSLLSFCGGMLVYAGAMIGLRVLEQTLSLVWLGPGVLLLVGGLLMALGVCRELRLLQRRPPHVPLEQRPLPKSHDSSYALSLATRTSRLPRRQ
jgi:hypothetical protein